MNSIETPIFLSPIIVLATVFLYGFLHSLLASLRVKSLVNTLLGRYWARGYRIVYNLLAVVMFLPVPVLLSLLPDVHLYTIPLPWSFFTLLLQVLAVLLLVVGLLHTGIWSFLGFRQLIESKANNSPELVVKGLYQYVRHPLYTAGLLFIWLLPVMTLNLLALVIGLSVYLVVGAIVEEKKLINEFGDAYVEYQKQTPMLIPVFIKKE